MIDFIDANFLFYTHFILVTLAAIDNDELSNAWLFSNVFLVTVLFVITVLDGGDPMKQKMITKLLFLYVFTIFTDLLLIIVFGPDNQSDSNEEWSLAASIFNLIAKFLFATLMILKKVGGVDMFDEGHQPSKIPVSYGSAKSTHGENLLEVIF